MNRHAQHDVHTVKMEHPKIIKNTVQRKNLIIQEKINQVSMQVELPRASTFDKIDVVPGVMQSQVHGIQAVQKPWKSDTSGRCPCRYATTDANDAKKVQNTKVVNSVKISQVQYIDDIVRNPGDRAEADGAEDAERTKRNTHGFPVCLNRPSPQEKCRQREDSR